MSTSSSSDDELRTIRAFIRPDKVDRWLTKLGNPRHRQEAAERIRSIHDFDDRWFYPVDNSGDRGDMLARLERTLVAAGAPGECSVISPIAALDRQRLPLRQALERVVGKQPALLSLVPGDLAYWEGEPPKLRQILSRAPAHRT